MKFFKLAILAFFVALYCSSADAELTNLSPVNHQISTDFYYFEEAGVVNYYKDAEDYIYDFYQGSLDVLSELAQAVKETGEHVYKTTESFALEVGHKTKEAFFYYLEVLQQSSYFCYDCAKESVATIYQTVEETSSEVCKTVQQEVANFAENVKDGYNSLQEKFSYFAWSHEEKSFHMDDEVAQKTKEAIGNGFEVAQHSSYEALDSAKESAAPYYQTAKETTFKVYNFAHQEVAKFAENVKAGYNNLHESTQQAAANFVNGVNDLGSATVKQGSKFVEKSSDAFESAKEVCEPYYKKFMAEVSKYYEVASGFSEVVMEKFTEMGNTF